MGSKSPWYARYDMTTRRSTPKKGARGNEKREVPMMNTIFGHKVKSLVVNEVCLGTLTSPAPALQAAQPYNAARAGGGQGYLHHPECPCRSQISFLHTPSTDTYDAHSIAFALA